MSKSNKTMSAKEFEHLLEFLGLKEKKPGRAMFGIPDVRYIPTNGYSDPEILYDGYEFNYWDVVEWVEDNIRSERNISYHDDISDELFNQYFNKENVMEWLDSMIYNWYIPNDIKSWKELV